MEKEIIELLKYIIEIKRIGPHMQRLIEGHIQELEEVIKQKESESSK